MALFGGGGGGTSKTKMTRPDYIQNLINNINSQGQATSLGDYTNKQYAGLNDYQDDALTQYMNNPYLNDMATQLIGAGEQGLQGLDSYYNQINDLYNKENVSAEDINNLASQIYSNADVNEAIQAANEQSGQNFARNTQTNIAEQYGNQAGFGSGGRLAREMAQGDLMQQQQANSSQISDQAYQNAMQQANSILTGNLSNRRGALGALGANYGQLAQGVSAGADFQQEAQQQALQAIQQRQANRQGALDTDYQNQQYAQNWGNMETENKLALANSLNAALGTTTTQRTTGGGGGMFGGMMSGAAAGSSFGPWGALAGAAIGAAASS